ncbi:MAG: phosphatase PAP2 family protein, partial [Oscillospiraceae bacterium]|nr:phosphatase PAP2 family protein [Oscillospiraceae bacterium]
TIAFSRLYLFVHFPTDVLASVVLGSATAGLAVVLFRKILLPTMKRAGWIALPVDVIEVLPVDTADTLPVDEVPEGGENEPGND